jgi:hypothetical protein
MCRYKSMKENYLKYQLSDFRYLYFYLYSHYIKIDKFFSKIPYFWFYTYSQKYATIITDAFQVPMRDHNM